MGRNVEIKARVSDRARIEALAARLSDTAATVLEQEDTFFNVPQGRLKLRILSPSGAQLIYYERPDSAGPKCCDYSIAPVAGPSSLRAVLSAALGVRAVVRKTRTLYLAGQTRIHFDEVDGLGSFVELEVALKEGQTAEEGTAIAQALMQTLEIRPFHLVQGAYADLLECK